MKDPAAALKVMTSRDAMMNPAVEQVRLNITLDLTSTPWVQKNGLSVMQPIRLRQTIDAIVGAYSLPKAPSPEETYTDKFLRPFAEPMISK